MRILVFSTLYPSASMPAHGVFVENRLRAFLKEHDAEVKVIAPAPWFPFPQQAFGSYGAWARTPRKETRHGIEIWHPRYLVAPKIGMRLAPWSLARCLKKAATALIESGWDFDFIDAHYFYPDGVAAAEVARQLGKPLAITARGTDVNLIPNFEGPRRAIIDAANRADAVITVASALKSELARLGAPEEKIVVLRNGVDLETFKPIDREQERRALGLDGPVIASVGHLIERKGHDLVIGALTDLPGATLLIAGEGPLRSALEAQARALGLGDRVRILGRIEHHEMNSVYNVADILVLASSREGWPNVLLEAMASGAPCVAANVWGASEVITAPEAGRLVDDRSAPAIATAVKEALAEPHGRKAVRAYAERYSWKETTDGMAAIFEDLADKAQRAKALNTEPLKLDANFRPRLIVTVDTEEAFDWSRFDNTDHRVLDLEGVAHFQEACEGAGVEPIYFLTWPILNDKNAATFFRGLHDTSAAHCGLHFHQWQTPGEDYPGEFYSFQKNLPRKAYQKKLRTQATAFGDIFGALARSHRAGRYGIGREDYELLAEIGVKHDFSPSAAFDFSPRGGPDFSMLSNRPFLASSDSWTVTVTPVSGAKAWRRTSLFLSQNHQAPGFAPYRHDPLMRYKRALRLSPEGASLDDLQALTRRLVADRTPVLTFTLHSTSLTPGGSPYARDAADVDRLMTTTGDYLKWFEEVLGGVVMSADDLASFYERASSS